MQNITGKRFVFDLDETICSFTNGDYNKATPYLKMINIINSLYQNNNYIIIFTARGTKTGLDWSEVTKNQLLSWGVLYHELIFGKPYADYYIDDKNLSIKELYECF